MGMETPSVSSDGERAHPCFKEAPFGILMSSLHSAKDFILPAVSSYVGRTFSDHSSSMASSLTDFLLASASVTEVSNVCQGASDDGRQALTKENHPCHSSPLDSTQSKLLQSHHFSVSNVQLPSGFLHFCTGSEVKNLPDGSLLNEGLQSRLSGLSIQGLSSIIPGCCPSSKQESGSEKATNTASFDLYESQKPSMGTSIFQTMMEHCLFASSVITKQAGQVMPLNDTLICAINDSKERVIGFLNENICIRITIQNYHQIGALLQQHDIDNKMDLPKCTNSASLGFARVGGDLKAIVPSVASVDRPASLNQSDPPPSEHEETTTASTAGLFRMPLPTIERLRSTLSTVSLTELIELVPQLGKTSQDFPDKKKLFSVQDFFRYTEAEGRRFFEELDRDNDGQVTLEDLEAAMRKRRLPQQYAREFMRRTRKHWFAKSFGWNEFLSLMEQKEPMMLRAYNSLSLSKSGTLQKNQVLTSLRNAGLPATEENAAAMMRCLDPDTRGSIAYGHFRNFMLLLPPERLGDDPRMVWFEAATVVPMAPPVAVPAESVLKSALAGGLACALSTSLMHPLDTMKTRVQASSTLSFPELISKLPEIGVRGLYRGSIPAILGQFSSHGLRTGIFEASKLLLTHFAPGLAELQVQSLASFCSTVLGTAVRIPCEVLKQRLQAGIFDSVGGAIIGTWQQDGPRGFFRGTGATLCREVPFYVAGMGIYAEAKKVMQRVLNRELEPWETIAVGALSGGLAAVCTTPFDVMKTRTMTAAPGMSTRMSIIALTIVREEGLLGLFKGAVPRFFWIAPLGAMNFAGYELAKRAMEKQEQD